jgi:senataxin
MSPELPHTLFSDIKSNPSFIRLLEDSSSFPSAVTTTKGKGKEGHSGGPLAWLSSFMVSLCPAKDTSGSSPKDSGFGEALAKILAFCYQDMQHGRFEQETRAAAATAGNTVSLD